MGGGRKALFDDEARNWESLYRDGGAGRWGIFQGNVRARAVARMELCLSLLPPVRDRDVIELGCGPGFYGRRLVGEGARHRHRRSRHGSGPRARRARS